jgi:DNA-binding winged helix-turn-helix (wHTH) protein/Tfp pilus assembly protein PilF
MNTHASRFYEFGPFCIDPAERLLLRDGVPVPLTAKVFDLLLLLVENSGHILERERLLEEIWPDAIVEEANLTVNIYALRKALGEKEKGQRYIETVPRRGYRFVGVVRELNEPSVSRTAAKSIAVLPFRTLGPEEDQKYLGLGMADTLTTKLSGIRRLNVRPTSVVLQYLGGAQDSLALGRKLRVDTVLDGCIQHAKEGVRVNVQLQSVQDGAILWGAHFDEKFTNIFDVQDSISSQVIQALALQLSGHERELLARRNTESAAAYQAYLRGSYYLNQHSVPTLEKAHDCFQQAIKEDPTYALAYAGLAEYYNWLCVYGARAPHEVFPKAKAAAMKVLEFDEMLAEAHTALAFALWAYDWNWAEAEKRYRRALALRPGNAAIYQRFNLYLISMSRFDEAAALLRRAEEIDPLSPLVSLSLGFLSYFTRQYAESIERIRKTLEMHPYFGIGHYHLGLACMQVGDVDKAIAELQEAGELSGGIPFIRAMMGYAYAMAGQRDEAQAVLKELEARSARHYVPAYSIAVLHLGLSHFEAAMDWLERALENRDEWLVWLSVEPCFEPLRSNSRFKSILRRVGFQAGGL